MYRPTADTLALDDKALSRGCGQNACIERYVAKTILKDCLLPSLESDIKDVFTARESSMGSSGGTTDVSIRVHSRNNLYLFLFSSSEPKHIFRRLNALMLLFNTILYFYSVINNE